MMKHIKNIIYLTFCAATLFTNTACNYVDGEGEGSKNAVYMETPDSKGIINFNLEPNGGSTYLTPRLANLSGSPVSVHVDYDAQALKTYNEQNNTAYEALPTAAFKLTGDDGKEYVGSLDAIIKPGDISARVKVNIGLLDEATYPSSKKYAIPFTLTSANGYDLIPSQRTAILLLNRSIMTSVAKFSGNGIFIKPVGMSTATEWTLQMSAIYSSLTRSNLSTFYLGDANGSFYTRISSATGIQVKNGRDGDDTWTQLPLSAGKWLNIAYVYKNNKLTVYVNGKVQKTFDTGSIHFSEKTTVNIGNTGYKDDYMREIRVWDKALTQTEINDYLYLPMNVDTPHLKTYIPLTKESGIKDLKAPEGTNNVTTDAVITYIENVKFPADELVIVNNNKTN